MTKSLDLDFYNTIGTAVLPRRKRPNKEVIKQKIDEIKALIRAEDDPEIKRNLAQAGLALNNILIK